MRKTKSADLKCDRIMVAVPKSFARYLSVQGASAFLQAKIAESVLGVSRPEYKRMYATEPDIRSQPEPLEKAYIRAARWILESRIHKMWQDENRVYLHTHWTLTDKCVICVVDLYQPGFVHVIYDSIIPSDQVGAGTPRNWIRLSDEMLASGRLVTQKLAIVNNWIAYSLETEASHG